jgi:hypothetical protein
MIEKVQDEAEANQRIVSSNFRSILMNTNNKGAKISIHL